jgi:5'-3' exonuclease
MIIHLVDGTYELFRCYFGAPPHKNTRGREVGATRALVRSLAAWLRSGELTHVAAAFDHVIESFRNDLFADYKTGEGVDAELLSQFELAERATAALGIVVWPMTKFEADDAIATAALRYAKAKTVEQVRLCSPDKDLAQCVSNDRIVLWDRKQQTALNENGVIQKFGVPPSLIPDLLALVGDTADGIPGITRWGMKSAAAVLAAHGPLERIPKAVGDWKIPIRGAESLAESLNQDRKAALLYRRLARLRFDVPIKESVSDLAWQGADRAALEEIAKEVDDKDLIQRVQKFRPATPRRRPRVLSK